MALSAALGLNPDCHVQVVVLVPMSQYMVVLFYNHMVLGMLCDIENVHDHRRCSCATVFGQTPVKYMLTQHGVVRACEEFLLH
jgi:hypothetical protein